ncbi:MAG: hotdog fold domain-containing protein [Dethiobacteria bacterium]|nr:hotdog fold domain-containing protein [Dethiobacteria bacterium]
MIGQKAMLRTRLSAHDVHYGGGLVDGALVIKLFGDIATELLIRHDGDEGLFAAYDMVEFKAQLCAGDYLETWGWIDRVGNTSRHMQFEAFKVIVNAGLDSCPSACDILPQPLLVARASGTCVVPKSLQRGAQCIHFTAEGDDRDG